MASPGKMYLQAEGRGWSLGRIWRHSALAGRQAGRRRLPSHLCSLLTVSSRLYHMLLAWLAACLPPLLATEPLQRTGAPHTSSHVVGLAGRTLPAIHFYVRLRRSRGKDGAALREPREQRGGAPSGGGGAELGRRAGTRWHSGRRSRCARLRLSDKLKTQLGQAAEGETDKRSTKNTAACLAVLLCLLVRALHLAAGRRQGWGAAWAAGHQPAAAGARPCKAWRHAHASAAPALLNAHAKRCSMPMQPQAIPCLVGFDIGMMMGRSLYCAISLGRGR